MKKIFFAALSVGFAVMASQGEACSYFIDELAAKNRLVAAVATEHGATLDALDIQAIDGFCWYESKSTPMCPDEITYKARIAFSLKGSATGPIHLVNVTEIDSWEDHGYKTYAFASSAALPVCTTAAPF